MRYVHPSRVWILSCDPLHDRRATSDRTHWNEFPKLQENPTHILFFSEMLSKWTLTASSPSGSAPWRGANVPPIQFFPSLIPRQPQTTPLLTKTTSKALADKCSAQYTFAVKTNNRAAWASGDNAHHAVRVSTVTPHKTLQTMNGGWKYYSECSWR